MGIDFLGPDIWRVSNGSRISQHQFSVPGRHVLNRQYRTVLREAQWGAPILKIVSLDPVGSRAPKIGDPDELWPLGSRDGSDVGLLGRDDRLASGVAIDIADLLIGSERVGRNEDARICSGAAKTARQAEHGIVILAAAEQRRGFALLTEN